jgi:hypothetical protein
MSLVRFIQDAGERLLKKSEPANTAPATDVVKSDTLSAIAKKC